MLNSKRSSQSSSVPSRQSSVSVEQKSKLKPPDLSEYEYIGRSVTREAPGIRKSKSLHKNTSFPSNTNEYRYSRKSHHHEDSVLSGTFDEDLSKPLSVIKINDRHVREIYRVPTPPPQVKQVFSRLQSPKPKIIERIFVRRPTPEIIEKIIEVPPKKVRIINREKLLGKPKSITRTRFIHLKPDYDRTTQVQQQTLNHYDQYPQQQQQQTFIHSDQYPQQQQQAFIPSGQYPQQQQQAFIHSDQYPQQQQQQTFIHSDQYPQQQQTFIPSEQYSQGPTTFAYPSQPYLPMTGHIQSTIPSHTMFDAQQYLQSHIPEAISYTYEPPQATPYTYEPQQTMPMLPPYGFSQY